MFTAEQVGEWLAANVLDTDAWDKSNKQVVAVTQAERNLFRWYPAADLEVQHVAYQAVWELQGLDPALKYQKHGVKTVADNGESVSYKDTARDVVAPDVRQMLGKTADELAEADDSLPPQYGGCLV